MLCSCKRLFHNYVLSLCLFLIILSSLIFAQPESKNFIVPNGDLSISMPAQSEWYFLPIDWYGELTYYFTPKKLSRADLEQGVDLEASISIKRHMLTMQDANMDIKSLLQRNMQYRQELYAQHKITLVTKEIRPARIAGLDGFIALVEQPDEQNYLFMGRRGLFVYEINYHVKNIHKENDLPIVQQMVDSIRLLDNSSHDQLKTYTITGNVKIVLPDQWFVNKHVDGDVFQAFISREEVVKKDDLFKVGVTITKISNFTKHYSVSDTNSDADIARMWAVNLMDSFKSMQVMVLRTERKVMANQQPAYFMETSLRSTVGAKDYYIQSCYWVTAVHDTLYAVILEAPVADFERYRAVYEQALANIVLL